MIDRFLKENNITTDIIVVLEVKRIYKEIDLENINAKNIKEKLKSYARIYNLFNEHSEYLSKHKNFNDSLYHKERDLLKQFMEYYIIQRDLPITFDEITHCDFSSLNRQNYKPIDAFKTDFSENTHLPEEHTLDDSEIDFEDF